MVYSSCVTRLISASIIGSRFLIEFIMTEGTVIFILPIIMSLLSPVLVPMRDVIMFLLKNITNLLLIIIEIQNPYSSKSNTVRLYTVCIRYWMLVFSNNWSILPIVVLSYSSLLFDVVDPLTTHVLYLKYVNGRKFEKVKSVDEVSNLLLHNVYRWKAYYLSYMTALLV